jgi:hypothetical protein
MPEEQFREVWVGVWTDAEKRAYIRRNFDLEEPPRTGRNYLTMEVSPTESVTNVILVCQRPSSPNANGRAHQNIFVIIA